MAIDLAAAVLLLVSSAILPVAAQLSGSVGPTTSSADKAAVKICNILDYGGAANVETDNASALQAAWDDCKTGGQVYIPEGDYGLATWLTLKNGNGVSINLEGTIYRTGSDGGNMIMIRDSSDFEFYSATSKGAFQGYGYEFHKDDTYGPRILRLYKCTNFSVHDIILVDAPQFHLSLDTCTNGELYNMVIRGGNRGGLDGIDVWGTNIWIHDVEVTNKDECVTVKNPSDHLLIEQIHCNWSGGSAIGSLGTDTDIHDIEYTNIYTHHANQMMMIKSNGGDGNVYNVAFNNFVGHSNAYTLDLDSAWSSMSTIDGDGIQYSNISFTGWRGTASDGVQRGPVKMLCPAKMPCTDIRVEDFHVWTEKGSSVLQACYNAYGSGSCLREEDTSLSSYTSTITLSSESSYAYSTMANELTVGLGLSTSIAIPTMPASFFPGLQPFSTILSLANAARDSETIATATPTSNQAASPDNTSSSPVPTSSLTTLVSQISVTSLPPTTSVTTTETSAVPETTATATLSLVNGEGPWDHHGHGHGFRPWVR